MIDFQGWLPALLQGAWTTIQVAVLSSVFGIAMGMLAAWGRLSRSRILQVIADAYATGIRAIPQLLLILLIYFGSTALLNGLARTLGWSQSSAAVPPYPAGIFALGIIFGAYATEVFKGAFQAVPKGMVEAGMACGMTRGQIFRLIKLPQMLRFALPGLGNIWVSILKDTSLISVVGLEEIMRISELATTSTQRPLFFYVSAAAIFFIMTLLSDIGLDRIERWARRGEKVA